MKDYLIEFGSFWMNFEEYCHESVMDTLEQWWTFHFRSEDLMCARIYNGFFDRMLEGFGWILRKFEQFGDSINFVDILE